MILRRQRLPVKLKVLNAQFVGRLRKQLAIEPIVILIKDENKKL